MTFGRFLATLYAVVFLALSLFASVSFVQTSRELTTLETQASESRQRLAMAERELQEQERVLALLRSDPQYVEAMIRRQLGYAKTGELVFRFRD